MRKEAALPAVLVTAVLLNLPAPARAGTYDVVSCRAPGGELINRAWTLETYNSAGKTPPPPAAFYTYAGPTDCSLGSGIGFGSTVTPRQTVKQGDGAGWTFRAPAGTTVRRAQVWRYTAAATSPDDPATTTSEGGSWTVVAHVGSGPGGPAAIGGESCPGTTITDPPYCRTGEAAFDGARGVTYDNLNEPIVSWGLECQGSTPATLCFTSNGAGVGYAGLELRGAVVTVEDRVPPEAAATGALDGWQPPGAARAAAASDSAGIRRIRVLVDGAERASETYPCDFHLPAPCPLAPVKAFDFSGVGDGWHTLVTIAEDTAGNVTRADRSVAIDGTAPAVEKVTVSGRTISAPVQDALAGVAGGAIEVRDKRDVPFKALKTTLRNGRLVASVPRSMSMSSLGIRLSTSDKAGNAFTSLVTSMSLSTRVGKRSRKVRNERASVPYGRAVTVLGRLTTTDGSPIANQAIVITGVLRRNGATPEPVATAQTDTGGRFSVPIPAGPSRVLSVTYSGAGGFLQRTRAVALRVPASATIHAANASLRGAGTIRFSGRLRALGTPLPPGGKIVDLQASQNGRWSTVATTRASGPNGSWRAVARFRGTPGRYPVRLRIRREALFPYELGYSASVVVGVR